MSTTTLIISHEETDLSTASDLYGRWQMLYRTEEACRHNAFSRHDRFVDLKDYEAVASLSMSEHEISPYIVTQNIENSWSRDARDGKINGVTLVKPLEVDEEGREWGHRSSMVGDMIYNPRTGVAYIIMPIGWSKCYTVDAEWFSKF